MQSHANRKLTAIAVFASFIFTTLSIHAIACLPLQQGEHYHRLGWSVAMPVADSVVIEGCQSYTALQNNIVRSGHYQGSFFDYKHFWCLDEELEIVWNPIFERYQKTAYYGAIVNVDLEQLILDLLDGLFIPAFDQFIKPYLNNGNPACEPYCPEGDGINPFSGNYYFSDTIISVDMPYMKLTYNSSEI